MKRILILVGVLILVYVIAAVALNWPTDTIDAYLPTA
jgi:hypothetical protein